jgi:hypothetical protein
MLVIIENPLNNMNHPEHDDFYFVLNSKPNHTTNNQLESGDTGSKSRQQLVLSTGATCTL